MTAVSIGPIGRPSCLSAHLISCMHLERVRAGAVAVPEEWGRTGVQRIAPQRGAALRRAARALPHGRGALFPHTAGPPLSSSCNLDVSCTGGYDYMRSLSTHHPLSAHLAPVFCEPFLPAPPYPHPILQCPVGLLDTECVRELTGKVLVRRVIARLTPVWP